MKFKSLPYLFLVCLLTIGVEASGQTNDSYLFEKDGFRIHYVGNGGNCNGCEWIEIDGTIPTDAAQLFEQYVVKHKFEGISLNVAFNSKGGSLAGGIRLGRLIRRLGMATSVGKTVPEERFYKTDKGICYSACAYAFLGGVRRFVNAGEFGVHQFFTDALLQDPNGKIFSPTDFSLQQTIAGLLLSYVIEMGASAELVIEANKTLPTEMNLLTKKQISNFRIAYNPREYGDWKLEAYRSGLITYSRTQDEKTQMTVFCGASRRAELVISFKVPTEGKADHQATFNSIQKFSLLGREIQRTAIRLEERPNEIIWHVPLTAGELDLLEGDKDPYGAFSVHLDEPRIHSGFVYEQINLMGLTSSIRLIRRNCV